MLRLDQQARFWLIGFVIFALLLWATQEVILPFAAGMVIAYFLDPVVEALTKRKLPRWLGTLVVLLGFGVLISLLLTLIVPLMQEQVAALIHAIPAYVEKLNNQWLPKAQNILSSFAPDDATKLQDAVPQSVGDAAGVAGALVKKIISGGMALFDLLMLFVITPIVAFFMLMDWPKIKTTIDGLIPRAYYGTICEQLGEIDKILSGFIRGQAMVCVVMAIYYSIGLSLTGLSYGVTVGVLTGILTFIPMVGTMFGWVLGLGLAFAQFDGLQHVAIVAAVFLGGNLLENYFITPKLVGDKIGLHPLWIMFALFVGGNWLGFAGVLIALPTAAVVGVVTRFLIRQYKGSRVYKGAL